MNTTAAIAYTNTRSTVILNRGNAGACFLRLCCFRLFAITGNYIKSRSQRKIGEDSDKLQTFCAEHITHLLLQL